MEAITHLAEEHRQVGQEDDFKDDKSRVDFFLK